MNTAETIIVSDIHLGSNYSRADKEYLWEYDGHTQLAIHGHRFGSFINNYKKVARAAYRSHKFLQYIENRDSSISRYLLKSSGSWFNLSYKIVRSAVGYVTERGINKIFCGHTNEPMSLISENVNYYKTGCCTSKPSSFISICNNGVTIPDKH